MHDLPKTLQLSAELEDDVAYRINLTGSENDPLLAFFSESCTIVRQRCLREARTVRRFSIRAYTGI